MHIHNHNTPVSVRFGPSRSVTRPQTMPAGTAKPIAVAMTISRCVAASSCDRPPPTDDVHREQAHEADDGVDGVGVEHAADEKPQQARILLRGPQRRQRLARSSS